jgi:RNA polymerase sigma-70 factor, ECF subfamily
MAATPTPFDTLQKTAVVARPAKGEELDEVLARYLPRFYRYALRYLGNAADAEDAVQDAVVSAYRHLAQFRQEAQISTWLVAIVLNSARMQLRRRLRAIFVSLDYSCGDEKTPALSERLVDDRPNPEDQCRRAEMKEHLDRIMPKLSPPLLRTFRLRHVDGLSIRETTNILNVPEGTVKARLARARRILQSLMRRRLDKRSSHRSVRRA